MCFTILDLLSLSHENGHTNEGDLKITLYSTSTIDENIVHAILGDRLEIGAIGNL